MIKATYNGFDDNTLTIISTSDTLNAGEEYCLEIVKEKRTTRHFNLFWLWISEMAKRAGYSTEEMKYWLFLELGFIKVYINRKTKQEVIRDESVANNISKERLNEIMKEIDLFAKEHGIDLPNPENLIFENLKEK